jgi:phosphoglycerate dehydrogenase-like enzyme/glyoxylase-like metal-dependent hydrolase (beta-lactamase superfamily II)
MKPLPLLALLALAGLGAGRADDLPPMKFNDVREVAPGVFFRYSSISATDETVPFGGSNNIWVVFQDYVLVVDANFPKEAGDVIAAIRKTTDKPIRYVLDTHHHGDHAYGNAVWAKEGATVVAQRHCFNALTTTGPQEFKEAGQGPTGRKDVAASYLKAPSLVFDDLLVFDDGTQRVELRHFGHAHTRGDAVAYLPKHHILCTGDACVNGAFNYMGHCDSASWIRCLEGMEQLDVRLICPGHGPVAGKDLLGRQKRYFQELRQQVQAGIDAGKPLADVLAGIEMPWYKEWTGKDAKLNKDNVEHVYKELTGQIVPAELVEDLGLKASTGYSKAAAGWAAPKRIVVPNLPPARLEELKRVAPEVSFVVARTAAEAAEAAADADAVLGFSDAAVVKAAAKAKWLQVTDARLLGAAGMGLAGRGVTLTDLRQADAGPTADHFVAMLLALTGHPDKGPAGAARPGDLQGRMAAVVGLDAVGREVARRLRAFGVRTVAVDAAGTERPETVFGLAEPDRLPEVLKAADVVVVVAPVAGLPTPILGAAVVGQIKAGAVVLTADRALVDLGALQKALEGKRLGGVGLDFASGEPLPSDHPFWRMPQVMMTPRPVGALLATDGRAWRLWRENVRRFAVGEPLLGVIHGP